MLTLILVVLFGVAFSYFATQNTSLATILFTPSSQVTVPMYLVILGALLVGLLLSLIFHIVDNLSSSLALHGRENTIKDLANDLEAHKQRIHELEVENAHLRGEREDEHRDIVEERRTIDETRPSFLDKLRYRLSM